MSLYVANKTSKVRSLCSLTMDLMCGTQICLTYVIDFVLQLCCTSGSVDWMACMCAVDYICFCVCWSLVLGETTSDTAKSWVLSYRLVTFGMSLVC